MIENSKGRERPNFVSSEDLRLFISSEAGNKLVNEHQQPKSLFEGLWSWGVYRRQQNVESEKMLEGLDHICDPKKPAFCKRSKHFIDINN